MTPRWVRDNVRPKVQLGHNTIMYYERDVDEWMASSREEAA